MNSVEISPENAKLCTMSLENVERVNPIVTETVNMSSMTPSSSTACVRLGWTKMAVKPTRVSRAGRE